MMDAYLDMLVSKPCVVCGEATTVEPANPEPWCLHCALLDIRTPEELAMTDTLSLAAWDEYRKTRDAR